MAATLELVLGDGEREGLVDTVEEIEAEPDVFVVALGLTDAEKFADAVLTTDWVCRAVVEADTDGDEEYISESVRAADPESEPEMEPVPDDDRESALLFEEEPVTDGLGDTVIVAETLSVTVLEARALNVTLGHWDVV